MSEAILKISWRTTPKGLVEPGSAVGGVCGTSFSLESGVTLTSAHNMENLFRPHEGYDHCRVFVAEPHGRVVELPKGCVELYPEYDAAVIRGYTATKRYRLCGRRADQIDLCGLDGYIAKTTPFSVVLDGTRGGLTIMSSKVARAAQVLPPCRTTSVPIQLDITHMNVSGKLGYVLDTKSKLGLSGGPVVDSSDGGAIGMCLMGLPRDMTDKDTMWAIDIRQFPFL